MANSLYNELSQQTQPNGVAQIVQEARRLKQTFKGNPRSEVERLLSTGQMSQQQFNQLSQIASQIIQAMN